MPDLTHTPTFPEGTTVRDTVTGKTYEVAGTTRAAGWTIVNLPEPDDDGNCFSMLPTDELELVEGRVSNPTDEQQFTAAVKFADGFDTIQARISSDGDIELGYRFDYEGHEKGVEGAQPFLIDRRHLGDFVELLRRVHLALIPTAELEAEAQRRGLGDSL